MDNLPDPSALGVGTAGKLVKQIGSIAIQSCHQEFQDLLWGLSRFQNVRVVDFMCSIMKSRIGAIPRTDWGPTNSTSVLRGLKFIWLHPSSFCHLQATVKFFLKKNLGLITSFTFRAHPLMFTFIKFKDLVFIHTVSLLLCITGVVFMISSTVRQRPHVSGSWIWSMQTLAWY